MIFNVLVILASPKFTCFWEYFTTRLLNSVICFPFLAAKRTYVHFTDSTLPNVLLISLYNKDAAANINQISLVSMKALSIINKQVFFFFFSKLNLNYVAKQHFIVLTLNIPLKITVKCLTFLYILPTYFKLRTSFPRQLTYLKTRPLSYLSETVKLMHIQLMLAMKNYGLLEVI